MEKPNEEEEEEEGEEKKHGRPYYVDSHVHLLDYDSKILEIILKKARDLNITHILNNACSESQFDDVIKCSEKFNKETACKNFIIPSIGLHPWFLKSRPEKYVQLIKEILLQYPHVQVGEIGLDFCTQVETPKSQQIEIFTNLLNLGIDLGKVISIHCVRSHGEMLQIFKKVAKDRKSEIEEKQPTFIMHSYGGAKDITKSMNQLGINIFYSFSMGIVKRPQLLEEVQLDQLIVQTDSPHQLDVDLIENKEILISNERKEFQFEQLNEPNFLPVIIQSLTSHFKLNELELSNIIFKNSLRALKLLK